MWSWLRGLAAQSLSAAYFGERLYALRLSEEQWGSVSTEPQPLTLVSRTNRYALLFSCVHPFDFHRLWSLLGLFDQKSHPSAIRELPALPRRDT